MNSIINHLAWLRYKTAISCVLAIPAIYLISRYNYNLFHSFADGTTIVIAASAFTIIWNSRHRVDNDYFLYTGIAFLFFAFLDAMHLLGNKNMGIFPEYGNLGPTFYIASRYILSISLLIAPLFIKRKLNATLMFAVYSLITLFILLSVFYWQIFPVSIVEGEGLTPFKVVSDYVICLILFIAIGLLLINRQSFDSRVLWIIASSIILSIATGLTFTLYTDPFGITNLVGHLFQLASFYLVYLALVETSLTKPQEILFRKLKQNEEKLTKNLQHLDDTNVLLNQEIAERKRAEEGLRQNREWLRVTLSSIGDAVLATDTEGRITFLNPVAEELTGWTLKEALGHPAPSVFRIMNELTRATAEDIVGRVLREEQIVALANHTALVSRDGREIPIEDSAAPIKDASGKLSGVVLVFHDVTEKRKAQVALHESEQRVRRKLESVLSPEGDFGVLELGDLIDTTALQKLMNDFYEVAQIPMSIIDIKGQVLVGVGWQDICTRFHRVQPDTRRHCMESDIHLSAGLAKGEYKLYKCKNNLWDMSTPIIVAGQHVGNILTGQFFFEDEPVDRELFRAQAQKYGFEQDEFLAALDRVPRLSRETIDRGMSFFLKLADTLSQLGYSNVKLARLLAERDRLTDSLQKSEFRFKLLSETAGRLLSSDNPQHIINELCRKVMATLDCQAFFNFLVDEEVGRLRLNAFAGIPEDEAQKIEWLDFSVAFCGCSALERFRIVAEDISNIPDPRTELVKSYGIQAYACHPLMVGEKLIGTLSFGSRSRSHFFPDELDLMKTVADQVAQAMERISLIRALEKSRDELELRVQERTTELSIANKALRNHAAKLERLNEELEEFAWITAHDLQEPVRKIQTFGHRLEHIIKPLTNEGQDDLRRMIQSASRMASLIKALKNYSDVTREIEPFKFINLEELIRAAMSDLEMLIQDTGTWVEIYELPFLEVDSTGMRQVFQNLISNSIKYARENEKPIIRITSRVDNGMCQIFVEDNGIGFDEKYLNRIFKPFQRLHSRNSNYEGTGMGLSICRKVVEMHGGTITARSTPGKGSTFIIRLPMSQ